MRHQYGFCKPTRPSLNQGRSDEGSHHHGPLWWTDSQNAGECAAQCTRKCVSRRNMGNAISNQASIFDESAVAGRRHKRSLDSFGNFRFRTGTPLIGTGPLLGQAHSWDKPLGQAHSWDRPTLGTGPLLGQTHSWDRPTLGTGPLKCLGQAHPCASSVVVRGTYYYYSLTYYYYYYLCRVAGNVGSTAQSAETSSQLLLQACS